MSISRDFFFLLPCFLVAAPSGAREQVRFIASPFRSQEMTVRLLDAADIKILLPLGYEAHSDTSSGMKLKNRRGAESYRLYRRRVSEAAEYWVELAVVSGPLGGFELAFYGEARGPEDPQNEDLPEIRQRFDALLQELELGHQMYRLGHIEAAQALALLKALGYVTMEFRKENIGRLGEGNYEQIFELMTSGDSSIVEGRFPTVREKLPIVINVVAASKTSLMEEASENRYGGSSQNVQTVQQGQVQIAPRLGGTFLHNTTAGEPQERLLIVYARNEPESLEKLLLLLKEQIDVPAQQIVIEALVVEINVTRLRDLGVDFSSGHEHVQASFPPSEQGADLPFTFVLSSETFEDFTRFKGRLEALAETGDAEILASPSVLVLDDRQARIQVGQQIPVLQTTITNVSTSQAPLYFPIGIVLNLRPRINTEDSEVTMQVETIISALSQSTTVPALVERQVAVAPVIDNRQVETFVRVADGTPFIIGGLLSTDQQQRSVGIPIVSRIPLLGYLFKRESVENIRREVIVVITPHIVPLEAPGFSYLIPKDSSTFDRFDTQLFRNVYRVRDDDVFDLKFIRESNILKKAPFDSLLSGSIPGEEVLVRRMLYEIVEKLGYGENVDVGRISFFAAPDDSSDGAMVRTDLDQVLDPILGAPEEAVLLLYDARSIPPDGHYFSPPVAAARDTLVSPQGKRRLLGALNSFDARGPRQWAILLADREDVDHLCRVLVLKSLLEINEGLPKTLADFRSGLQILFPSREEMRDRAHLIDRETARFFYETEFYYTEFERIFNQTIKEVEAQYESIR